MLMRKKVEELREENASKIFMGKNSQARFWGMLNIATEKNDRNTCQALEIKVLAAYLAETK